MAGEWQESRLEDCMDAIIDYRGKTPKKTVSGIPLITAKIIKGGAIQPVSEYIAEDDYDSWMRRGIPESGDIVMTTEAPLGEVAQLDDRKVALAQRVITLRGKSGVLDNTFLKYLLSSHPVQHQLEGRATGTTVKGIKQSELRQVSLSFPSYDEQKAIAHILGTLDDKIELNRQMNATLEAMAQALFKSWFVDFDPVIDNALAAGNPIPEPLQTRAEARKALGNQRKPLPIANGCLSATLPEGIQNQFPNRFVFNDDMGWVPEGWEVTVSGKVIDVRDGTHDSPKQSEAGYQLVTSKHITSGKLRLNDAYLISEEDFEQVNQRSKVQHGDILLTMIGTVGIPYLVMPQEVNFAIKNIGLFRTSQAELYRFYFYLLLKSQGMKDYLNARMAGTTQKYLSLKALRSIEFLSPEKTLLEIFNKEVQNFIYQIQQREEEAETLAKVRDTLLPKLLSGQLRIPEAEKQVAEAL